MVVYVLFECDYADNRLISIFSTYEKAKEIKEQYEKKYKHKLTSDWCGYVIEQIQIDGQPELSGFEEITFNDDPVERKVTVSFRTQESNHPPLDLD